ncbi:hypothetical protein E3N88_15872 [Mikania micrantha]|uniref:Uncharacterized protein n=1 Tax=Mikania micrantha TaxID=192012 RepID=A0A5N6NX88_9ASTR|nr:hypothetical protein E3N88_15872 [Mikania micrantha]
MVVEETKGKPREGRRIERENEKKAIYTSIKNRRKVLTRRTITRRTHKMTLGEEPERRAIKGRYRSIKGALNANQPLIQQTLKEEFVSRPTRRSLHPKGSSKLPEGQHLVPFSC